MIPFEPVNYIMGNSNIKRLGKKPVGTLYKTNSLKLLKEVPLHTNPTYGSTYMHL